jgi:hypothetical protein
MSGATDEVAAQAGVQIAPASYAIAVDPATNEIYDDEGTQISVFASTGGSALGSFGFEQFANSRGVAIDPESHMTYVSSGSGVIQFGYEPSNEPLINNPAAVHALNQASTHSYGDFQVSANGDFAVFSTVLPDTGYPMNGHREIYRYGATEESLDCVSCAPTLASAIADASLPSHGLALTNDGRVFFTSPEQLVLRDTNGKDDAYEWESGSQQLISDGIGTNDSSMYAATPSGVDAFFFTRAVLSGQDENGSAVKVYDAREFGGFPTNPPAVPCSASDECHGNGTPAPGPPDINTVTGSGQASKGQKRGAKTCKKGPANRRRHCARKKRHHRGTHRNTRTNR